ncbi:MAG: PA14 domain-containing protein, partial [Terriglobales bacterium]
MLAIASAVPAFASDLTVTYFQISNTDPSYNQLCCGTYNNEVLSNLGPNGLPVLNPAYSGTMPAAADVDSNGELTWWSPALNSNVTQTGTGVVSLPLNFTSFYPPNGTGTSDANGGLAAIFSGTLNAPTDEVISFSIGADDSAFAYLDGVNVCDLGGVHGDTQGSCVTPFTITAGNHNLKLFFVDMNQVDSALNFDITTQGVTT